MAEQVGKLTVHIGGKQHAHELLVPLEQLAAVEESTVSFPAAPSLYLLATRLLSLRGGNPAVCFCCASTFVFGFRTYMAAN